LYHGERCEIIIEWIDKPMSNGAYVCMYWRKMANVCVVCDKYVTWFGV
jgi:hypothetical protein